MANKTIIKEIGLHEAIILGSLCCRQSYWDDKEHRERSWFVEKYGEYEGFFFCTAKELEEETTLSPYQQRNALNKLEEMGFIETKLKGVPATKWMKVNERKLVEFFLDDEEFDNQPSNNCNSSCQKISQLDSEKFDRNKNKSNKNKTNNKEYSETKEVSQDKKKEKHSEEIKEVITYLNDKLGTHYRFNSAAAKHIPARLAEGFTVDDFKVIIDKKFDEWHGTEFERYLRPATLFSPSHFEDYLNQSNRKSVQKKVTSKEWDGTFDTDETF